MVSSLLPFLECREGFSEVTQLPELQRWCRGGEFFQKPSLGKKMEVMKDLNVPDLWL